MVGGLVGGPQMAAGISYVWPKHFVGLFTIVWDYGPKLSQQPSIAGKVHCGGA